MFPALTYLDLVCSSLISRRPHTLLSGSWKLLLRSILGDKLRNFEHHQPTKSVRKFKTCRRIVRTITKKENSRRFKKVEHNFRVHSLQSSQAESCSVRLPSLQIFVRGDLHMNVQTSDLAPDFSAYKKERLV